MKYDAELRFFLRLLHNMDLPVTIFPIKDKEELGCKFDIYMRLYPDISAKEISENIVRICRPSCICHLFDEMMCNYLLFRLPDTPGPSYVLIGPYTLIPIPEKKILENAERLSLPPSLYMEMERFYINMRLLGDTVYLTTLINTLGEALWGSLDAFTWKSLDPENESIFPFTEERAFLEKQEEPYEAVKLLEDIYQLEARFSQAVMQGQTHKAEMLMQDYTISRLEHRIADPVRNVKNYTIVLNTILRKAVEEGGVHPIHIDRISSMYAKKIELVSSQAEALRLHREMVRKYCLLVKNHSMKNYSPFVKKVLTFIDTDLTSDLSLKANAERLNMNASYLSTLFKKEMGVSLTEYVNRARISHAVSLLNTTGMQVQMIAQFCGIPDVNYFTKMFKKYIGKTPQEYRRHIGRPLEIL